MFKKTLILAAILFSFVYFVPNGYAEYESIYHYYTQEGIEAFYKGDFENAIFYFKTAHAIDPTRPQPLEFINLIKREQEREAKTEELISLPESKEEKTSLQNPPTKLAPQVPNDFKDKSPEYKLPYIPNKKAKSSVVNNIPFEPKGALFPQTERSFTQVQSNDLLRHLAENEEVRLNDKLWAQQKTPFTIEMELGKGAFFVGKNIAKFLITNQNLLTVVRVDRDRIRVSALRRGNTILYVWDDKGRWTFNIRGEYTYETTNNAQKQLTQEQSSPFRLGYSNSWSSYYKGPDLNDVKRQSIFFTNWLGISGETPYGYFDASIDTNMFPDSTEVVGQRIGLNDAKIGPFKDFTIRGYDVFKELSALTLAGRNFRGFLIDAYAFNHNIAYSYFTGQDQSTSIYTSTSTFTRQNSYVEGFKLILNPDLPAKYAFNYAHGYGDARPVGFKDEVYSIETRQRVRDWAMRGELGYDRDVYAGTADWNLERNDLKMNFSLSDIDKNYQTVYGTPSNAGLVSGIWGMHLDRKDFQFSSFVDIYNDRVMPNEDHPDWVNLDLSTSISKPLDDTSNIGATFSYTNAQQIVSPREFAQESTNYSKGYKIGSRYLSLSLGQTWQWSRNELSPTSDYDRFSLRAGFRVDLIRYLFYSLGYEYIWVRDVSADTTSTPSALQTGLTYSVPLTEQLYFSTDLNYRNEQQSTSSFSFLAGEDSVGNILSLTYKPSVDLEIYADSQIRKVWSHNVTLNPDYVDWNLSVGMRGGWDLPFRWSPTGEIRGIVYKDYNGNSLQDKDEPGMAHIKVLAGKFETLTNENGEYKIKINAKKANVSLDFKAIPKGFVFSTALSRDVMIQQGKPVYVNFGLTSRSGIYGIAYVDLNATGKPDRGDKFISNVVLRLDTDEITRTDQTGAYFFENIAPGVHKIRIDVNSINIQYSPAVKIESSVKVDEGMTYVHNIPLKENPKVNAP